MRRVDLAHQAAQPRRVRLGQVDEPGADQRRAPGQVEVVADQHRVADLHARAAARRRRWSGSRSGSRRRRRPARRGRPARRRVPRRGGCGRGRRARACRRPSSDRIRPACPSTAGGRKPGRSVTVISASAGAERVDGRHPAGAEDDRDVVPLDPGAPDDLGRGALGGGARRRSEFPRQPRVGPVPRDLPPAAWLAGSARGPAALAVQAQRDRRQDLESFEGQRSPHVVHRP